MIRDNASVLQAIQQMQAELQAKTLENAKLKVIAQRATGQNLGVDENQLKKEMQNG
jgi:hypothetical protein